MENIQFSGARRTMKTRRTGAEVIENFSADSLARLLGVISPKISTTIVTTIVDIVAPISWPKASTKIRVARAVRVIFTMLLPMRMVESSLSKFSERARTREAR